MNRTPTTAAVAVLVATLAATAALAAALAAGPVAAASQHPADEAGGYVTVTDDTSTISAGFPSGWAVQTQPRPFVGIWEVAAPGAYPTLSYNPDPGSLGSSFIVQAIPISDHGSITDSITGDFGVGCDFANYSRQPYDAGGFAGERSDWLNCYEVNRHTLVADYGSSFTLVVEAISTGPADDAAFEHFLQTMAPAGGAATPAPSPGFPFGSFEAVPQLGSEGVRGSGCGSQGQIGDVVPDGWWAGFAPIVPSGDSDYVDLDLLCVFSGEAAQQVLAQGDDTIIRNDPSFLIVNNNTRTRPMPVNDVTLAIYEGVRSADGSCVPGPPGDQFTDQSPPAWVHIANGLVDVVFYGCVGSAAPNPSDQANLPPAHPDYGDGVGSVWPYGQFWNVPQLGREPVRGSGCGSQGQIGSQIPDGLWAGYVDGYDSARNGFWVDLLCIFSGESAQAVLQAGTANIVSNEPDYLIVNNSEATRFVPNALDAIVTGQLDGQGNCVEGTHLSPESLDQIAPNANRQAWIRVDGGAITWIFYGC